MKNPYDQRIAEIREVMSELMRKMCAENEMKVFRNMAAVYVEWQHDLHLAELAALDWKTKITNL